MLSRIFIHPIETSKKKKNNNSVLCVYVYVSSSGSRQREKEEIEVGQIENVQKKSERLDKKKGLHKLNKCPPQSCSHLDPWNP